MLNVKKTVFSIALLSSLMMFSGCNNSDTDKSTAQNDPADKAGFTMNKKAKEHAEARKTHLLVDDSSVGAGTEVKISDQSRFSVVNNTGEDIFFVKDGETNVFPLAVYSILATAKGDGFGEISYIRKNSSYVPFGLKKDSNSYNDYFISSKENMTLVAHVFKANTQLDCKLKITHNNTDGTTSYNVESSGGCSMTKSISKNFDNAIAGITLTIGKAKKPLASIANIQSATTRPIGKTATFKDIKNISLTSNVQVYFDASSSDEENLYVKNNGNYEKVIKGKGKALKKRIGWSWGGNYQFSGDKDKFFIEKNNNKTEKTLVLVDGFKKNKCTVKFERAKGGDEISATAVKDTGKDVSPNFQCGFVTDTKSNVILTYIL